MSNAIVMRIKDHLIATIGEVPFPPVAQDAIARAEASLGFKIPETLKSIYLKVANGGFGPAYGIIGLNGGRPSNLGTLVETYEQVQAGAKYHGFEWQSGFLPFCEWGCNIFSCVDCNDARSSVYQSEECDAHQTDYTLEDFFNMWLDGVDILGVGNSPKVSAEMINPFTRKKVVVFGTQKKSRGKK